MIREVREQADVFGRIIQNRTSIATVADKVAKLGRRNYYAVGCGSSYYAAMIAAFYDEHVFGLDGRAVPSSEFIWYPPSTESTVLMALSRSGKTSETLEATRTAKRLHIPAVAITADPSSPMGREADYCLNIEIGEERSVVMTKSFTASTLLSTILGLELSKIQPSSKKELEEELMKLPSDAERVIREVESQARTTAESLGKLKGFIYLGSGASYGACLEGALKLRETSYTACEVYHLPEFRHGPLALLQDDVGVVAVVPEDKTIKQSEMLLKEMGALGATVVPISSIRRITDAYKTSIRMPDGISAHFMPLLSVIPMQMVAFYYAVGRGLNPDSPRNLTRFISTDFSQ